MKFDKKQIFSLPRRRKPKVLTLKTMFPCCVRNAIYFGVVLLAFVTLPAGCYLLESWLPQEKNNAILLLQMLILLLPLAAAGGACGIAFITAAQQNDFLAQAARERNRPLPEWDDVWLYLPGIRYWFLYRHLAGELPGTSCWRLRVMLISAAFFWISLVFIGPLSPIPFCALAVSIGFWLGIARRIAGVPMQKKERLGWMLLLGCFLVSMLAGYILFYRGREMLKAEIRLLQNAGIPGSREELKTHLYQGVTPNVKFAELVDQYRDSDKLTSASGYYASTEAERREIKAYLSGERCRTEFLPLESLVAAGGKLKYPLPLSEKFLMVIKLPHRNYHRAAMRYFSSRIIVALEEKNAQEALRLFRLMTDFQESVLQSDFLIGSLTAFSCESIRLDVIGALLGSGLLSDAQLQEVARRNQGRNEKLYRSLGRGLQQEAFAFLDAIRTLMVPYPEILRTIRRGDEQEFDDAVLNFLFRGNTTSFPTFPCLWLEVVLQWRMQHCMRYQSAVMRYFSDRNFWNDEGDSALKRQLVTEEWPVSLSFSPDYFSERRRFQRMETFCRMADLALQIEMFRRKHGRLPETLDELGIPLPVDALSGEPIRFTRFARLFGEDGNGGTISRDLPGWQLSAPGRNHDITSEEQQEYRRDFFTVITQWPVPAPPEPPKNNEGSFDFMGSAGANEEAAP